MKEELEKLGFLFVSKNENFNQYELHIDEDRFIWVCEEGMTFIQDFDNESVYLFDHNYEKLKQLIKLLS